MNLACAITLEKLSLKILIKDVIRRMLVMQTKMSFSEVSKYCRQERIR